MSTDVFNNEAEQSLLGGIMLNNHLPLDTEIHPSWFYRASHRTIFAAMQRLDSRGETIDSITVSDVLRQKGHLDEIGGATYLAGLVESTPSMNNESIQNYARIIREKSTRRETLKVFQNSMNQIVGEENPIEEIIAQVSSDLANIENSGTTKDTADMKTLMKEAIPRLEARKDHPNSVTGTSTGFKDLDKMTNGLQPGDLIVIAGRPSMGKTALAQQAGEAAAYEGTVGFFTLEMDKESLCERSLASWAGIPSQALRSGRFSEEDWPRLVGAARKLSELPIEVVDSPALTAQQIRFRARQIKARKGNLALVIVDYLGLIRSEGRSRERYLEVGEVTRKLKQMARELKVPVVLVCQLNRSCESRQDKRPLLSDLRESGDIEQDADVVLFLYRDEYYCDVCRKQKEECMIPHQGVAEVNVAKQRKGPVGTISLVWQGEFTRFKDRAYGEENA